jgi:AcrR family transcriptional regulator
MTPSTEVAPRRRTIKTVVRDKALIAQRHEEIFRAASRVFISRGYDRATVREIAKEAGLSLGSLYSYIKTKEDILYLVFDKLTTTLRKNIRGAIEGIEDPVAQVKAALRADIETTLQYQDEILLMYQETKSLDRHALHAVLAREAEYVRFWEDILRSALGRGGPFTGDARLSAEVISYLCSLLALRRWSLRRRFSGEEATEALIAFVLRGLGVVEGDRGEGAPLARP